MEETGTRSIEDKDVSRRKVFYFLGWGVMCLFFSAIGLSIARFFFPRLLYEPPTKYKIGFLSEFTLGVSEKFMKIKRIWVVREEDKLYVIKAVCTHLGCTPFWLASEGKFKCPCHGSGFTPDGVNIEGPAPRPLERVKVAMAEDGQIIVDESVKYRGERGQWGRPGSFISV
ncbi:MAG: Rieske 2Fe-2S iron sulfur protein (cytochrome b6-F complex) [Candidatus Scalindua rubra]|uniref:Rieske 2Fe-2S iron sulfur protein (Cytochrome b6-F complex) n=1 Tax=Candidatus Scalindua rubra TaxID=1872076 RepID=A0A1E3X729_9BACT|nr:MAG: Rieske 2Fe-2S iron sulfur protein (cytochrome b6-F complex) [Candidatus Scalindua rubra]